MNIIEYLKKKNADINKNIPTEKSTIIPLKKRNSTSNSSVELMLYGKEFTLLKEA